MAAMIDSITIPCAYCETGITVTPRVGTAGLSDDGKTYNVELVVDIDDEIMEHIAADLAQR